MYIYIYGIAFGARNAAITSGIHQFLIGRSKKNAHGNQWEHPLPIIQRLNCHHRIFSDNTKSSRKIEKSSAVFPII